ncbi:MAG: permease-like cell division protein FtsX [Woeseiaceae bacterium]
MALTRHADAVAPIRSSGPVSTWFSRHAATAFGSLVRLLRQPFASLMIMLVIAVTLAIPAALNLVVHSAVAVSSGWANALDFSIYLKRGVSESEAKGLAKIIGERADVESVRLISADEALADFKKQSGFGDALDALTENPLPHTLVIRPAAANTTQSIILLQEELGNLPEAEFVQADTDWVRRFHAILDIVRRAIVIGASLLGLAIVVIIGNTIRLDIQNRREEIEVTKLIGASNGFVRRPFLWSGFWYGLTGGLLALGLVQYGLHLMAQPAARLASLYQSTASVLGLSLEESLGILGIGVLLGLVGSWFAVARHLRRIEPR